MSGDGGAAPPGGVDAIESRAWSQTDSADRQGEIVWEWRRESRDASELEVYRGTDRGVNVTNLAPRMQENCTIRGTQIICSGLFVRPRAVQHLAHYLEKLLHVQGLGLVAVEPGGHDLWSVMGHS